MRNVLPILLLIISLSAKSQTISSDSLIKYSYFINSIENDDRTEAIQLSQGTGFFIKKHDKTILKTAKHVLLACDYYGKPKKQQHSGIWVNSNGENGLDYKAHWSFLLLDVIKNNSCLPFYSMPDTISLSQNDALIVSDYRPLIYSVEKFNTYKKKVKTGALIIYGFPLVNSKNDSGYYAIKRASKIQSSNYVIDSNFRVPDVNNQRVVDSINYRVYLHDYTLTAKIAGFSGAPVFVEDVEKKEWVLLGLVSAVNTRFNTLLIVKHKYISN